MPPQADPGERQTTDPHARGPGVGAPSRPDVSRTSHLVLPGSPPLGPRAARIRAGHLLLLCAAAAAVLGTATLAVGDEPLFTVVGFASGVTALALLVVHHRRRSARSPHLRGGAVGGPFDGPGGVPDAGERVRELEHRLANLLGTVSALLDQSRRTRDDPAEALAHFERRLGELRRLHTFLGGDTGPATDGASLRALTLLALEPYGSVSGPARVHIEGPDVVVPRVAVLPLGTALCELATNAVKYGALSGARGHVEVGWTLRDDPNGRPGEVLLDIGWVERDGPPVGQPGRRGYGTSLLERGVTGALGGEAHLEFASEGLTCWMSLPFGVLERDTSSEQDDDTLVPEPLRRLPTPPHANDPRRSESASP